MAISVYLGKVTKRKNSTFRPSLTAAVNVVLKEGTSDTRPAFLLNSSEPVDANYLIWGERYYFIDDITYERNNLYTIRCSLDVLATYKSYIAATSAFVLYDPSGNTELIDSRLSAETSKTIQQSSVSLVDLGADYYIALTITGYNSTGVIGVGTTTAQKLLNASETWLNNPDILPVPPIQAISDIPEALQVVGQNLVKGFRQLIASGNINECVKSASLIPVSMLAGVGSQVTIYLGNYNTGLSGALIAPNRVFSEHKTVAIPWQASDWRRNAPFHEIYLSLPFIGTMQVSPSDVMGNDSITVSYYTSAISGDTVVQVYSGSHHLATFHTNVSSSYAIGSANTSPMAAASGIGAALVGTAAAVASGGTGAIIAASAGLVGSTGHLIGTPSTFGTNSGSAYMGDVSREIVCTTVFHDTHVAPGSISGVIGTPTMAARSLGSLSGYIECQAASVSAPAEAGVLDTINNYLNSGFFME